MDVRPETTVTGQLRAATETGSVPAVPDSQQTEEKTTDRRSNLVAVVALVLAMIAIALVSV